jgi:hypothetical protein
MRPTSFSAACLGHRRFIINDGMCAAGIWFLPDGIRDGGTKPVEDLRVESLLGRKGGAAVTDGRLTSPSAASTIPAKPHTASVGSILSLNRNMASAAAAASARK